jgi:diguanylate cyclase (GGDEF)-like protein
MKGWSVALELSRFLTALFNPQSLMSIGAFNCLLIVILSLMQSRKNSTFSAAMRYFAVGVFLAGWSMFSYVVTDSGSSARVLLSYCTHVLSHTFGVVSTLYFFDQVKIRNKTVMVSVATLCGFLVFWDATSAEAWRSLVSAVHLVAVGVIAYRSNQVRNPRAKYVVMALALFALISTMPWLYKYYQLVLRGEPDAWGLDNFALAVSALVWSTEPILFYALLIAIINLRVEKVLKTEANVDALTGIANRRRLLSVAQASLDEKEQDFGQGSALFLIDIDHFKKVNDSFGHTRGDKVLIHCAQVLQEAVRPQDTIGRYGGEEFCVIANDIDLASATQMAERLCNLLRHRPYTVGGDLVKVTASVGLKHFRKAMPLNRVFEHADHAMYRAKKAGRDQACISEA